MSDSPCRSRRQTRQTDINNICKKSNNSGIPRSLNPSNEMVEPKKTDKFIFENDDYCNNTSEKIIFCIYPTYSFMLNGYDV